MSMCIAVVVNRSYQRFVPMFTYFCLLSYSNYGVKLFLTEQLRKGYVDIMEELKSLGSIDIYENCFPNHPKSNQELKSLRWILSKDKFKGYDNIYIGDVDILICREDPSIEQQHISNCESMELPYSNILRPYDTDRLSGLHFIRKDEYYKSMDPVIRNYSNKLKAGSLKNKKNEYLLHDMVVESGMGLPTKYFWPHHGIHLGWWRKGYRMVSQRRWHQIKLRDDYKKYLGFFKKVEQKKLYKKIYNIQPLNEIDFMRKALSKEFANG